jgi:hypothetical protein
MPNEFTTDINPQKLNPRSHHQIKFRSSVKGFDQVVDRVEGRSQISIQKPDVINGLLRDVQHTRPDGSRLSPVLWQNQSLDTAWLLGLQLL